MQGLENLGWRSWYRIFPCGDYEVLATYDGNAPTSVNYAWGGGAGRVEGVSHINQIQLLDTISSGLEARAFALQDRAPEAIPQPPGHLTRLSLAPRDVQRSTKGSGGTLLCRSPTDNPSRPPLPHPRLHTREQSDKADRPNLQCISPSLYSKQGPSNNPPSKLDAKASGCGSIPVSPGG